MIAPALFGIAASSLWANKLRSGLTLLGVVFGVTSVMTIISALEGMMGAIEEDLAALGPTTFVIERMGIIMSEQDFLDKVKRKPLNLEAAELIKEGTRFCDRVTARTFSFPRVTRGGQALRRVFVMGAEASIIDMVDFPAAAGRFYSAEDDTYRRRVAFIGNRIGEDLFPGVDPIGKTLKIDGQRYTVIGVAKKRGSFMGGDNEDNFICIPLSTHGKQFGPPRRGYSIFVRAESVELLDQAMDECRAILRSQRHVPYNEPDDFDMLTADNVLEILNSFTKIIRFALIGISSISLVVGGIVVMNIMMVSVTERTREIGIRKSLGAKRKHILLQFLFESLVVTCAGGIIGIVGGYILARMLVAQIGLDLSPSGVAIFAGLFISTSVGLFFGIYPALKAARLDPVKALSYE